MKKPSMLLLSLAAIFPRLGKAQNTSFFISRSAGGNLSQYSYTADYADAWTFSKPKPGANGGVAFGMEYNTIVLFPGSVLSKKPQSQKPIITVSRIA